MAVREMRRKPNAAERMAEDRVRRARAAQPKRDPQGVYHALIGELAKQHGFEPSDLLDQWDELVSMRLYAGEDQQAAERNALDDITSIVEACR
jgi:hypothetical protein